MADVFLKTVGGATPVEVMMRASGGDFPTNVEVAGAPTVAADSAVSPVEALFGERPFYMAHRLGGTEYPEHTTQGMNAAIQAGFTAFEFSTYRTRDGVFIGSHDWTTERTTGVRHEIWDTDWVTIQQLQQEAGPITRIEQIVEMLPDDSVLVVDHKATSAKTTPNPDEARSEAELFALLATLFKNPQERVVWKLFANSNSEQRARERGFTTMCMLYPPEVPDADLSRWDVLGMEYSAPQDVWDVLKATGKPTIGHIITSQSQRDMALSRGADGLMSSVPTLVHP